MVKRKRDETEPSGQGNNVKRRRVQHKLKVGITKIGHAFKISKGFERQKLGKRRKNAVVKDQNKDVQRIDSEIAALKALDTIASAQQHFSKNLLKNKEVSNHPDLPPDIGKPVALPADGASMNVYARLCKANHVTDALNGAIADVQKALGLDIEQIKQSKKRRLRTEDYAAPDSNQQAKADVSLEHRPRSGESHHESDDAASGNDSEEGSIGMDDALNGDSMYDSQDGTVGGDDVEALERRLASEGYKSKSTAPNPDDYDLEADLAVSESESYTRSASPEPRKASRSGNSSFIPSLTLGGYVEGSGSDVEDDVGVAPRKNKRGQRARRQIWEQKYGSKAKHLQEASRNVKWDSKRGAVGASGADKARGSRTKLDHGPSRAGHQSRGETQRRPQKDDNGPIHPSWEAAKKAKQKDAPAAFQGKKITFT